MAGTLTISTLSDGTNSTSSTNCIQGSAKAWVRFTGTTGAIVSSYNVSSVSRTGTGQYTITYTNAMSDANYALSGFSSDNSYGSALSCVNAASLTAATAAVFTSLERVGFVDVAVVCVKVHR